MVTKTVERITIIGSGNWGSAIAKIIGNNVLDHPDTFERTVRMWVFQEQYNGENLTDIINREHENVKYLPGIKLPENVYAEPDLLKACENSNILVFVLPHQFIQGVCQKLHGVVSSNCKAISLIKGLDISEQGISLISEDISQQLGINCAVLSGANIANEVAQEKFCETTIGATSPADGEFFYKMFHTPYFRVNVVQDKVGVELCGALKNVVAVAAGLVDGLALGDNTKAAIIRRGLLEMRKFGQTFFKGVQNETFFESCGVADLITTCSGGRNRKVAAAFVTSGKPIDQLEAELLNGQKLQGTSTAQEVNEFLTARNMTQGFPLFTTVYRIIYEGEPCTKIVQDV
ncbi:hypothetical protein BZG36_03946 [Bifiguratus adelaidae]|uniref:Glycerol-3-phosphate dehydrogenase [NAD(+)] n=1 Tax=Bifiguratus adelaidae TaxID=1938954 RepID=A0A261XZU6_9FUNG|nr:hypothetical protein BZG36_03946 [Bifiguratus adelaidae]